MIPNPDPPPAGHIAGPLSVDGMIFRELGQPWRWKGITMFRAAQRWSRGEDLAPLLLWTRAVGGNLWRIFCQTSERFGPDPIALTPEQIRSFCLWAGEQGLRIEATVLCDCEQLGQGFDQQVGRLRAVVDAVKDLAGVVTEAYNEPFANTGGVDLRAVLHMLGYDQHRPMLMASGDYEVPADNPNGPLVLDYFTHHPARKEDWPVESGKEGHFIYDGWGADEHNAGYRGAHRPVVNDEPIGASETLQPWRRDNRPEAWEDAGAGMAIGSAGGTFHCDDGIQALVPGPVQTECARRFFAAMDWFPADVPTGRYTHGGVGEHPLFETTDGSIGEDAARVFPDRAYVVCAQPKAGWTGPKVKPGWTIARTYPNGRGNILELRRA